MKSEACLIPFNPTDLTGNRVLVFAPHPDDETFACGGSLAIHSDAGDPVKVVFLTNGAKGDFSGQMDVGAYIEVRKKEAVSACSILGVADLEFWSYEDRALAGRRGVLRRVIDLLETFRPDLVYAPSPLEFHPDHRAASLLVSDAIRSCDFEFEVAFYEVGQPLRVNLLVDITKVLDRKVKAIGEYKSQLHERPYGDVTLGLNRYRSMTLPPGATHAEGFSFWRSDIIRKLGPLSIPLQEVQRLAPDPEEAGPLVSVIVRTKGQAGLLANAIGSIVKQTYANIEIVVVNDGGEDVCDVVSALASNVPFTYLAHEQSLGRSATANTGLKAAKGFYVNILDDDGAFYPDHVEKLVSLLHSTGEKTVYSKASEVPPHTGADIQPNRNGSVAKSVPMLDPDLLIFDDAIPIATVLFERDVFSRIDRFCADLDAFGDWDFLIRLSQHFGFQHLDQVTCESPGPGIDSAHLKDTAKLREEAEVLFERVRPFIEEGTWWKFVVNRVLTKRSGEAFQETKKGMKNTVSDTLPPGQAESEKSDESRAISERPLTSLGYKVYRVLKGILSR
jgi:LmbE family N-acetylglucosaminyl deacetylase/glycosyltransferase involved in cell wall biosynthesis